LKLGACPQNSLCHVWIQKTDVDVDCAWLKYPKRSSELTSKIDTPGVLAQAVVNAGFEKVDVKNKVGSYIYNFDVNDIFRNLFDKPVQKIFFNQESYGVIFLMYLEETGNSLVFENSDDIDQKDNQFWIIHREDGIKHFSLIIINVEHRLIYVFDTFETWSLEKTIRLMMPHIDLFKQGYRIQNYTNAVSQKGDGTCGPYSIWIAFAYAFNYKGCRDNEPKSLNTNVLQINYEEILPFWQMLVK
jgi:hypothetical protein